MHEMKVGRPQAHTAAALAFRGAGEFLGRRRSWRIPVGRRSRAFVMLAAARLRNSRVRYRGGGVSLVVTALAIMSGCTQPGSGEQPPAPNWKDPIGGVPMASVAAAQLHVPFRVRVMPGPRPYRILIAPRRPRPATIVILQYRTSFGLVDVYEETPQVTARQFRRVIAQWVALNGNSGTSGATAGVSLHHRYPALLSTTQDGRRSEIEWIEAGVEFVILGPSLSKQDCIRLAGLLAS